MIQDCEGRVFAMAKTIPVRTDYTAGHVHRFAKKAKDATQARRLSAIAAVPEGPRGKDAAKIDCMDRQTLRDWVIRSLLPSAEKMTWPSTIALGRDPAPRGRVAFSHESECQERGDASAGRRSVIGCVVEHPFCFRRSGGLLSCGGRLAAFCQPGRL
jgi:hypothetical protein